jgi:hypothetical protein
VAGRIVVQQSVCMLQSRKEDGRFFDTEGKGTCNVHLTTKKGVASFAAGCGDDKLGKGSTESSCSFLAVELCLNRSMGLF